MTHPTIACFLLLVYSYSLTAAQKSIPVPMQHPLQHAPTTPLLQRETSWEWHPKPCIWGTSVHCMTIIPHSTPQQQSTDDL